MKNNFIIILLICFSSLSLKAELIFENEFPKNIQGIWSEDCEADRQVHVIGKNSSLWIDEEKGRRVLIRNEQSDILKD